MSPITWGLPGRPPTGDRCDGRGHGWGGRGRPDPPSTRSTQPAALEGKPPGGRGPLVPISTETRPGPDRGPRRKPGRPTTGRLSGPWQRLCRRPRHGCGRCAATAAPCHHAEYPSLAGSGKEASAVMGRMIGPAENAASRTFPSAAGALRSQRPTLCPGQKVWSVAAGARTSCSTAKCIPGPTHIGVGIYGGEMLAMAMRKVAQAWWASFGTHACCWPTPPSCRRVPSRAPRGGHALCPAAGVPGA